MRQPVPLAPILADRWEPAGAQGIELLPLNQDPATGARTALIRSVPREGFACKAQYHHCEEEFLCLEGRFTFDGRHWMEPLSYTCYPSHVVHGARVSVPGGYLLYLRTSGPAEAYPVAEPLMDEAYQHTDSAVREPILVLERGLEPRQDDPQCEAAPPGMRRRVLRAQPQKGAEVSLWEFGDGTRDLFEHFPAATSLEVLLIGAGSLAYGCYGPGDARPSIDAAGAVVALVHSGPWD